jgi:hypothetical protein
MKFGHNLPRNQVPEWAASYINYKGLKKLIKTAADASKDGSAPDLAGKLYHSPKQQSHDEHAMVSQWACTPQGVLSMWNSDALSKHFYMAENINKYTLLTTLYRIFLLSRPESRRR